MVPVGGSRAEQAPVREFAPSLGVRGHRPSTPQDCSDEIASLSPESRKQWTSNPRVNRCRDKGGNAMRVFHSTNGKVQGGQLEAAVGTAVEAAKLLGAHGGEIRFFMTLAGGEDVNGTLFSQEYESSEALATAFDVLADDVELQALLSRLSAPGSPTLITSQSLGMEMPLGRTPKAGPRQLPRGPQQPHQPWSS